MCYVCYHVCVCPLPLVSTPFFESVLGMWYTGTLRITFTRSPAQHTTHKPTHTGQNKSRAQTEKGADHGPLESPDSHLYKPLTPPPPPPKRTEVDGSCESEHASGIIVLQVVMMQQCMVCGVCGVSVSL